MQTEKDAAVMAPTTLNNAPQTAPGDVHSTAFTVTLENFEGPFDLLLSLISRRKLDITDIALATVTDEFLQYISALFDAETTKALDQASDFLVTAATLLDLKAARLLPQPRVASEEDIALLEARDLLFARLLQYRAYRDVAEILSEKYESEAQKFPRSVALEPQFAQALPELVFTTTPEEFARIAAVALSKSAFDAEQETKTQASTFDHLREPLTTIAREEQVIIQHLSNGQAATFYDVIAGSGEFEIAVVRFLAVLELFRRGVVDIDVSGGAANFSMALTKAPSAFESNNESVQEGSES